MTWRLSIAADIIGSVFDLDDILELEDGVSVFDLDPFLGASG